jgi:hypothetical protein
MSKLTLEELSGVMCQHMTYNNEASRLDALAAVLDRLADYFEQDEHRYGTAIILRSIAHPPAPAPDVEAAAVEYKRASNALDVAKMHLRQAADALEGKS